MAVGDVGQAKIYQNAKLSAANAVSGGDANPAALLRDKADHALGQTVSEGGGAPVPTSLGARFDVTPAEYSFGDAPVAIERFDGVENKKGPQGKTLHHRYSYDTLKDTHSGANLFGTAEADEASPEFQSRGKVDWNTHGHLKSAGHAGRFVSVSTEEGGFTGKGTTSTRALATIDMQKKREVGLDEVLDQRQLTSIYGQVDQQLASNPQGQSYMRDPEALHSLINQNFALNQEDGKTVLTVQLPATNSDKVADFAFALPPSVSVE